MRLAPILATQAGLLAMRAYAIPLLHSIEDLKARTTEACSAISSTFPDQLFWPNTTQYTTETHEVWSGTCIRSPNCVFEPNTAQDLSAGLKLIKQSGSKFSVRSGGHMPVSGAQSIDDGVFISMSKLNGRTLNADKSIASIGPGQTWIEVYEWLAQDGLAVNGGKFPSVGVGGVLIGGGIGYFSGSRGWGCDDVVGYEVVLADGRIVQVAGGDYESSSNVTYSGSPGGEYSDLFWALKGGHNNFGIVTRYDMRTLQIGPAYGGLTVWRGAAQDQFFDALNTYMTPGNGVDDPEVVINPFASIVPANGSSSYQVVNVAMYPGTNPNPPALEPFANIDSSLIASSQVGVHDSWTAIPRIFESVAGQQTRHLFWAVSFKGDPRAFSIHNRTVVDGALAELGHVEGLRIITTWQPISRGWLEISKQAGGNVIDLDPETDGTFVAGRIESFWNNAEDDDAVYSFSERAAQEIDAATQRLGLHNPFIYLNEASGSQKPFESLGGGRSLPKLRRIQAKYDPDGFLKNSLQHGFSLD
ncbi:FAD binding domain protein [Biscogniauxia marginata]|nr:FAD binding domain protein [Biscogniauxia marginata]